MTADHIFIRSVAVYIGFPDHSGDRNYELFACEKKMLQHLGRYSCIDD